jgi:hypothetical protein
MDKDTTIKFVGQPIFAQIIKMVSKTLFSQIVSKHQSDRYYKEFKTWDHFVSLMFAILSRCDSIAEIVDGMAGLSGKMQYIGLQKVPAKSTFSDGMRKRTDKFFEDLYFALVKEYSQFLSDSKTIGKQFQQMLLIDSTTIRLFTEVLKGVGRNRKDDGKKKGGAKVHMVINAFEQIGQFIAITPAKTHDKKFLELLDVKPHSLMVFDRAYNHYLQFAKWSQNKVYFITRKKSNAKYTIISTVENPSLKGKEHGVHKDEIIELQYKENKEEKTLRLRLVTYYDEEGRYYTFLSNSFEELTAEEVAACYKKRWDIELLFKKLKQNFQLHYFYGENETAIKTQIWCTLIAQLLLTVIQKQNVPKKAFSTVACTVRIHLISMLDLVEVVKAEHKYYEKEDPMAGQVDIFGNTVARKKVRKRPQKKEKAEGQLQKPENKQENTTENQFVNSS